MTLDLFTPGAYARAPGGNLDGGELMAPVVDWLAWSINPDNSGAGDASVWAFNRSRWRAAGIAEFPWLHCHSLADIDRLIDVGLREGSPAIGANLEDVATDFTSRGIGLADVAAKLARWPGPVHMATLTWVQNGQGWSALKRVVAALEVFPDEAPIAAADVPGCIAHAFAEGLENVTLMFKTKPPNAPADYDLGTCHSFFTADDIGSTAEAWNRWKAPAGPCEKLRPVSSSSSDPWYGKPYLTGAPVGPDKLPRALYPPAAKKGTFAGDDVLAYKRAISRAGRWLPWNPSNWSPTYGDPFARGKGTSNVGDSGVRGFQRQTWPDDEAMQTGNLGDKTYQALRRARVSDPEAIHYGEPLFDTVALRLLRQAAAQYRADDGVARFRLAVADYCERAEGASSSAWTYTQRRPFGGFGVAPDGGAPFFADCSGYTILAYFWGRTQAKIPVPDPSGYAFSGFGNTWDDLDGHPVVSSGQFVVGDLAHYNGHVTICKRAGDASSSRWSSFGSEPKPREETLWYRPDLRFVVRPPLK